MCVMLHNIFVRLKDEWEFEGLSDEEGGSSGGDSDSDAADDDGEQVQECTGACFQDAIRDRWLLANGWIGDDNE